MKKIEKKVKINNNFSVKWLLDQYISSSSSFNIILYFYSFHLSLFICFPFLFQLTDSSSTNTENISPSVTPPTSASKTSPNDHSTYLNTSNESDDEGQEMIEDDGDDSPDRPSDSGSPNPNGSMQSKRKKKTRTVFSRAQVFQLESTFDLKR